MRMDLFTKYETTAALLD